VAAEDDDRIIGTADAAKVLGWSQRKVQRAVTTGAIPIVGHIGIRRDALFRATQIEELAHQGETPDLPPAG
jgi:hypothetical protein